MSPQRITTQKKIALFCQFETTTANGILMRGRADAFAELGYRTVLMYHPFKFESLHHSSKTRPHVHLTQFILYSRFFGRHHMHGVMRICAALRLIIIDIPRVFLSLRNSHVCFLHKCLPLSFLYLCLLRIFCYRGSVVTILDDWEGVGGFATVRNSQSVLNRLAATGCEEVMPLWVDMNLCVSKVLYERLRLTNALKRKTVYLPNGAPARLFHENENIPDEQNRLRIGYVGTFKNKKLCDFLIEVCVHALSMKPDMEFILIGGGNELNYLLELRKKYAIEHEVRTTGQISHEAVQKKLACIHICLVYLNGEFPDTFIDASRSSVKLFEYMAAGKGIIASDFGEPQNIIKDGETGLLAHNDPWFFAKKIEFVYNNRNILELFRKNVQQEFREKYTHTILMQEMLNHLEQPPV